jgi:hypothetical protein
VEARTAAQDRVQALTPGLKPALVLLLYAEVETPASHRIEFFPLAAASKAVPFQTSDLFRGSPIQRFPTSHLERNQSSRTLVKNLEGGFFLMKKPLSGLALTQVPF